MDIVYFVALEAQILSKLGSSSPTNLIPRSTAEKEQAAGKDCDDGKRQAGGRQKGRSLLCSTGLAWCAPCIILPNAASNRFAEG